jgi:hypothetical protein
VKLPSSDEGGGGQRRYVTFTICADVHHESV